MEHGIVIVIIPNTILIFCNVDICIVGVGMENTTTGRKTDVLKSNKKKKVFIQGVGKFFNALEPGIAKYSLYRALW